MILKILSDFGDLNHNSCSHSEAQNLELIRFAQCELPEPAQP